MRALLPALLLTVLASCGADKDGRGETNLAKLDLASTAFADGRPIPAQYTCDGANRSPGLSWGEPPAGTKSFALILDDPDAPGGTFRHWGLYDIPSTTRFIGEGQSKGVKALNDFGKDEYGGPCPPPGHGPHRYHLKLYALDVARLVLDPNASVNDAKSVEAAARKHAIAKGELVGTY
jgi:Raf kinase inhibitor-like YbhB/YbcL family protein